MGRMLTPREEGDGAWDGSGAKLEIRDGEAQWGADDEGDGASAVLPNPSWGGSARAGCWAMELANIPSVALICAPALDSDQAKGFSSLKGSASDQQYPFNACYKVFSQWGKKYVTL